MGIGIMGLDISLPQGQLRLLEVIGIPEQSGCVMDIHASIAVVEGSGIAVDRREIFPGFSETVDFRQTEFCSQNTQTSFQGIHSETQTADGIIRSFGVRAAGSVDRHGILNIGYHFREKFGTAIRIGLKDRKSADGKTAVDPTV